MWAPLFRGVRGYEVFHSIIKDSKHHDYRQTKERREMPWYVEFNRDEVNWKLKKV